MIGLRSRGFGLIAGAAGRGELLDAPEEQPLWAAAIRAAAARGAMAGTGSGAAAARATARAVARATAQGYG
ncbi:hypothetical protein OV450_4372 [Actinobacteria bacterium OV450]|nr:hypothetical protein OV450_4372 [Actinobacteria bacterium OV450]